MVDPHDLAEDKQALQEWASSRYAIPKSTVLEEVEPPSDIDQLHRPAVFKYPESETRKIMFTGPAPEEQVYLADIDAQLNVTNAEEMPFTGRNASIAYDDEADNWLVLVRRPDSHTEERRMKLYRMSRDLGTIIDHQDPLEVDGTDWNAAGPCTLWHPGGGGFGTDLYVFLEGAKVGVTARKGISLATGDITAADIPPLTENKWPVATEAPNYVTWNGERGKGYAYDGAMSPIPIGDLVAMPLYTHAVANGGLSLGFLSHDPTKNHFVAGVTNSWIFGPRPFGKGMQVGGTRHGHVTRLLGRGYTLLATVGSNYGDGYRKTYAMNLPWTELVPNRRPLTYTPWLDNSIDAGETSPTIPGQGRKSIYFDSDTSGDLDITVDPVGRNQWRSIDTEAGVTAARHQTLWEALRMRLKFDTAATVTSTVTVSPLGGR